MSAVFPPGPKGTAVLGCLRDVRRDPLAFLDQVTKQFGDIAHFRLAGFRVFLLNRPDEIERVLVTCQHRFVKGRTLLGARQLFGNGLLTSDGELHERQRQLIQPGFHRLRHDGFASVIPALTADRAEQWRHGLTFDIAREMGDLTLAVAARLLFGADAAIVAAEIRDALAAAGRIEVPFLPFATLSTLFFREQARHLRDARRTLDAVLHRVILDRRGRAAEGEDLLCALLQRRNGSAHGGMEDQQLRDELITLLLAAHDTTANALAWTWHLLSRNPDVQARLHSELDAVLGGREPAEGDLPALTFTRAVFAEAMRLYPPAWLLARITVQEHDAQGYLIPPRSIVVMSPWAVQRSSRYFPQPLTFNPDRWLAQDDRSRPRFAYFPFGGGMRGCMGEAFAWAEGVLVIATVSRRWQLCASADPLPEAHPGLTLRPKTGVPVVALRRTGA